MFDEELTASDIAERIAAQAREDLDTVTATFWEKASQLKDAAQSAMRNLGDA